ncbi:MAG: acyltransferase [Oscillospiraceae bacterium]|nr:acyltransferase [Oscillospiraceae bacterium]
MRKKAKKQASTLLHTANVLAMLVIILATATARMGEEAMFRRVLFSFHMPLFFLLSGLILEQHRGEGKKGWLRFIQHMVLAFVIPYFLWALIYSMFSYQNLAWVLYGSFEALERAKTLNILCFLPCMFVARLLAEAALGSLRRFKRSPRLASLGTAVVFFAIGLLLPKIRGIGYPWCINSAFVAAGFLLLGYSLRELVEAWARKPAAVVAAFVLSAALFCGGTVLRGERLDMVLLRSGEYGNLFWFFLNAFSGSLTVLGLSALWTRPWKKDGPVITQRDEAGISRVTLGTFVVHMPLLQQVILPLLGLIPLSLPPIVLFLAGMVVTKIISRWLIRGLTRFVPQLFGIYPPPKLLALPDPQSEANAGGDAVLVDTR